MVGIAPVGARGDALLLDLAATGVGHATVIRSAADRLEPADLDLALRYLPDIRAIVLVRPDSELLPIASSAASWSGAGLVVVGDDPQRGPDDQQRGPDDPQRGPDDPDT